MRAELLCTPVEARGADSRRRPTSAGTVPAQHAALGRRRLERRQGERAAEQGRERLRWPVAVLTLLSVAAFAGEAPATTLGSAPDGAEPAPANVLDSAATPLQASSVPAIVGEIGKLEQARDPKCYATASRLEDFMFGTPLLPEARFAKIELQKGVVRRVWTAAARAAAEAASPEIDAARLAAAATTALRIERTPRGDWLVAAATGEITSIDERDARQYGNVAYGLRAILAVQQEQLAAGGAPLLPLAAAAVSALKEWIDVGTLAVLQRADRDARLANRQAIDGPLLRAAWLLWFGDSGVAAATAGDASPPAAAAAAAAGTEPASERPGFATTRAIVAEKLAAYSVYNQLAMPIFLRNIQVYFARYRWPTDAVEGERFKNLFTEAMIAFTGDLLLEAEKEARARGERLVRVADVYAALQRFEPHEVNAYEDVVYFPRLPRADRIVIEAYDLDAFRDSGLHWFYLDQAISAPSFAGTLEPDPFAAELLTEGVAQLAGLVLRVSGQIAEARGAPTLASRDLEAALQRIQELIERDAAAAVEPVAAAAGLPSSGEPEPARSTQKFFTETTAAAGIAFEHRMADWLARLLRGYVQDRDGTVRLAVPPAFGGAGLAAEDVDNDGDVDLLLLSGSGNALYLNDGQGNFSDVTAESGLAWRRPEDGLPGEPRQPIIADFDNDGLQDILITYVEDDHRLYRNLGGHRFADVTESAGLAGRGLVGGPATAFDYDGDGLLDLYIGYFGDYPRGVFPTLARRNDNGLPNKLFRNLGGLRFADVSAGSGVANTGWTQAVGETDFDGDGRVDLIVGNDFGVNSWYRNLGGGKFEDVAPQLGTDKPSYTMNVGLTDLNRDGFPEVYISNIVTMNKDEKYVLPDAKTPVKLDPAKLATMRVVEANDLWMSRAENGKLVGYELSNAVGRGESSTGWAWGADFFDFDNDGDDDLYCVNGMNEYAVYSSTNPYFTDASGQPRDVIMPVQEKESNVFFVNRDGKLWNESSASGADWLGNSRSVAYLDADGDGDLDIAMNNFQGPAVFLRNNSERLGRHWLALRLHGDPARGVTRDAIGARIEVASDHHPRLSREVRSTTGYLSVHPKEQYLGLGSDEAAEVTVVWPNGERQNLGRLAADRRYVLVQGGEVAEAPSPGGG